jgi:hypothetical protein
MEAISSGMDHFDIAEKIFSVSRFSMLLLLLRKKDETSDIEDLR